MVQIPILSSDSAVRYASNQKIFERIGDPTENVINLEDEARTNRAINMPSIEATFAFSSSF